MNGIERGFGSYLRRFALSIDIVDDLTFEQIGQLIVDYTTKELAVAYFEVGETCTWGDGEPGLRTLWCKEPTRQGNSGPIRDARGEYLSHTAMAVDTMTCLWVVDREKRELADPDAVFTDLWSHADGLPPYKSPLPDFHARTSIIVPLGADSAVGVMYLESPKYQDITPVAKRELKTLAEAIATLMSDHHANIVTSQATKLAVKDLRDLLDSGGFPNLAKPHVFLASSEIADERVLGVIREVVAEELGEKVELTYWREVNEQGSIDEQIARAITECKFGICYLSEPVDGNGGPTSYRDNPNVLFEAGMLHALTRTEATAGWIPLREQNSPAPSFNVRQQRMLTVPREHGGRINTEMLKADLRASLADLLEGDE